MNTRGSYKKAKERMNEAFVSLSLFLSLDADAYLWSFVKIFMCLRFSIKNAYLQVSFIYIYILI